MAVVPQVPMSPPVDGVTIVMAVTPVDGATPITIVADVPMVAQIDGFNDALSAFQGHQADCGSSLG